MLKNCWVKFCVIITNLFVIEKSSFQNVFSFRHSQLLCYWLLPFRLNFSFFLLPFFFFFTSCWRRGAFQCSRSKTFSKMCLKSIKKTFRIPPGLRWLRGRWAGLTRMLVDMIGRLVLSIRTVLMWIGWSQEKEDQLESLAGGGGASVPFLLGLLGHSCSCSSLTTLSRCSLASRSCIRSALSCSRSASACCNFTCRSSIWKCTI